MPRWRPRCAGFGARAFRLSLATPLAGDPRFRPQTAALQAILPCLDDLVDGSSLAGLADFMLTLARPGALGRDGLAEDLMMQKAIDSHFHIWRQKDQPWLVGPMVPRIFGPYEPIRRDYPIEEFLADQQGLRRREGRLCPDQLGEGGFREGGRLPHRDRRRRPAGRMPSSAMPT